MEKVKTRSSLRFKLLLLFLGSALVPMIILFALVWLFFGSQVTTIVLPSLGVGLGIGLVIVVFNWFYTQKVITSPVQKINSTLD